MPSSKEKFGYSDFPRRLGKWISEALLRTTTNSSRVRQTVIYRQTDRQRDRETKTERERERERDTKIKPLVYLWGFESKINNSKKQYLQRAQNTTSRP